MNAVLAAQLLAVLKEKESRSPAMCKMNQPLIFAVRMAKGENVRKGLPKLQVPIVARIDGTVDVEFSATVTTALVTQLRAIGAQIQNAYPSYRSLCARIPVRSLEAAANLPGVACVKTQSKWARDAGTDQTEGDKSMRTDEIRSAFGLTGTGVEVGVISDSNDYQEGSQGTGDLPATVDVPNGNDGRPGSGEGTAMMEIVHDVAPGSSLAFNTAGGSQADFAQHYRDLFAAGCTVLSDDIFMLDEPAFQDGPIAQAINDIFAAGGICFSSAGNAGNLRSNTSGVWEGDFVFSGDTLASPFGTNDEIHWFGSSETNPIQSVGLGALTLQWNNPYGTADQDYDLYLVDGAGDIIDYSADANNLTGFAYEAVSSPSASDRYALVTFYGGANDSAVLRLNQIRGKLQFANGGQTWGHNSAENGIGVAAINAAISPQRAFNAADETTYYSSDGLRRIYFDSDGNLIATDRTYAGAIVRNKPVITGPDGVSTTVPGFQPYFYGTSAASPHAAALAALLREFAPDANPIVIRGAMIRGAVDILTAGFDKDSGYGAASGMGAIADLLVNKTHGLSPLTGTVAALTPVTFTLDIGRPAPPAGLTVNVTATGDTSRFSIPSSITLNHGEQTATLTIGPGSTGTGTANLSLTENFTGALLGTATVNRTLNTVQIASLTLDPAVVVGGSRNVAGKVTLSTAADATFTVELQSSNPAIASVPASVAISRNGTFKTFVVTTTAVSTDTPVTIRARKQGSADPYTEATLTVKAVAPISCVPSPTSGFSGTSVTFTVKLNGPAPVGGLTAGLTTTDSVLIPVPRTLAFAAGTTQKSFTLVTGNSQVKKVVTVSVRYKSQTVAQGKFTATVPEVASLTLTPNPVTGGNSVTGKVTLVATAPSGGVLVTLGTYGTGLSAPATVTVPAGNSFVNFTVNTAATTRAKTGKVYAKTSTVTKTVTLTINP